MITEKWKDIPEHEGLYQVSASGLVRSLDRVVLSKGRNRNLKGKPLRLIKSSFGYMRVMLYKNGVSKQNFVHRLVAYAFIENNLDKPYINHVDGVKTNNVTTNLQWCTSKENTAHAIETGLINQRGSNNQRAKLTEKDVMEIRGLHPMLSHSKLSKRYNISERQVFRILHKQQWNHI